jgi:mycothiol synthase
MTASPGRPVRVEVVTRLAPVEVAAVASLVEHATEADGVRPLSEHVVLHLRYGGDYDVRHVLVWGEGRHGEELAGYGHLDVTDPVEGSSGELAVHPAHRRRGLAHLIVSELVDATPDGRLRLWAHSEGAAAGRLARSLGFRRTRVLWQMRRSLFAGLPRIDIPAGLALRPFRPGEDDEAWIRLNAAAFVDLPDQGRWTVEDLRRRMREPWFDPEGFLLLVEEATGRLVGCHWTKVHGGHGPSTDDGVVVPDAADAAVDALSREPWDDAADHAHDPMGEVYVMGVDPAEQGRGLGRLLTVAGLRHLRSRGLSQAMLYVDAANTAAIRVYESLGFTRWDTDVLYRREVPGATV